MARTSAYYSKPPKTAKAALTAWNYFEAHYASVKRPIRELFYSPNFRYDGPHWVCILTILDKDLDHWNFSQDDVTWHRHASYFK